MTRLRVGITPDVLGTTKDPIFGSKVLGLLDDPAIEWEYIERDGIDVTPEQAARYDVILAMIVRVTRDTFKGPSRRLKLIARFGVGYDSIDIPACTEAGVIVTIAPDGVRRPVATGALTYVLMLAQKVLIKDRMTREGRFDDKLDHIGTGLTGRTLGSIGIGNIGAELFRLAKPFEMRFIAHDPVPNTTVANDLGIELVSLEKLFAESDFLCVNCPLSDATRALVSDRLIRLMKPTAYLINTARGPIVDEKALYQALRERRIAGAGLDVFEVEPAPASNPIFALDNVIVTPHGICYTDECMEGLARSAFTSTLDFAHGKKPNFIVNPDGWAGASAARARG